MATAPLSSRASRSAPARARKAMDSGSSRCAARTAAVSPPGIHRRFARGSTRASVRASRSASGIFARSASASALRASNHHVRHRSAFAWRVVSSAEDETGVAEADPSSTPPSSPPSTSDVVSGRHRREPDDRPGRRVVTSERRDRPGGLDGVREAGSAAEGDGGRTARALAIGDARGGMGTTTTLDASRTPRLSSSEVTTREETSSLAFPSPPRRARRRSTRR